MQVQISPQEFTQASNRTNNSVRIIGPSGLLLKDHFCVARTICLRHSWACNVFGNLDGNRMAREKGGFSPQDEVEPREVKHSNLLEECHLSNLLEKVRYWKSQVVYLGSFLWMGWVGDASEGRPIGGRGGGIPRLFDMMMTSAMAMFETAWITVWGGGLFFLCSSVIWTTSDLSPVT